MRPLGLVALAAYVERHLAGRVRVRVHDLSDSDPTATDLLEVFGVTDADVVGISAYSNNFPIALEWARALRARAPRRRIIIGGHHASHAVEHLLTAHADVFDYVIVGEGEVPLARLLDAIDVGAEPPAIPFVAHGGNPRAVGVPDVALTSEPPTLLTSKGLLVKELDDLPEPVADVMSPYVRPLTYYDKREHRVRSATAVVSSRGCPYGCEFCTLRRNKWRALSPERTIDWLDAIERQEGIEFEHVYFMDALLFTKPARVFELGRALQARRPGTTWSGSARADQLVRVGDGLGELAKLGLRFVEVGVEAGNAHALERYSKGTTVEQNLEAVRALQRHDIDIDIALDFIMFFPDARIEDIRQNLVFLRAAGLTELLPHDHYYTFLTPYLGTPLRAKYERLLDVEFPVDRLPDPDENFVDPEVRRVFARYVRAFSADRARVAKLIPVVETAALELRAKAPKIAQRLRLDAVTLRHIPFFALAAACDDEEEELHRIGLWLDEIEILAGELSGTARDLELR